MASESLTRMPSGFVLPNILTTEPDPPPDEERGGRIREIQPALTLTFDGFAIETFVNWIPARPKRQFQAA